MFDWFWKFLYSISKALMKVCDWMMDVANVLLGIDPITVNGKTTDFLTYLITGDTVKFAFAACCILCVVLLFLFTCFAIVRNIIKEQPGQTPAQTCIKALRTLLLFLFVPFIMVTLTFFLNTFMKAIFVATQGGSTSTIGSFLFTIFAEDAGLSDSAREKFLDGTYDYYSTSKVCECIEISDFNFIMSWIVSCVVMYNIAGSLLMFVDRAISIIILYIAAPFCITASVVDEGAHFKTWREQVLTKYLTAYGTIIAVNVYIMLVGMVTDDNVVLFSRSVINYVAKILIVLGGALSMRKAMALVGSLMSQGGAAEMNDPLNTQGRALAGKALKGAFNATPLGLAAKAAGAVGGAVAGAAKRKIQNSLERMGNAAIGKMFGADMSFDNKRLGIEEGGGSKNDNNPDYNGGDKNKELKDALEGGNDDKKDGDNANNNQNNQNNNIVANSINNNNKDDKKKEDDK